MVRQKRFRTGSKMVVPLSKARGMRPVTGTGHGLIWICSDEALSPLASVILFPVSQWAVFSKSQPVPCTAIASQAANSH